MLDNIFYNDMPEFSMAGFGLICSICGVNLMWELASIMKNYVWNHAKIVIGLVSAMKWNTIDKTITPKYNETPKQDI